MKFEHKSKLSKKYTYVTQKIITINKIFRAVKFRAVFLWSVIKYRVAGREKYRETTAINKL